MRTTTLIQKDSISDKLATIMTFSFMAVILCGGVHLAVYVAMAAFNQ